MSIQVFRKLSDIKYDKNTVLTLGTFDGIHLGHQQIISAVVEKAKKNKMRNFVFTFDPHPRSVLSKDDKVYILSSLEEKVEMFTELGVKNIFVIEFTKEFSQQSAEQFITDFLVKGTGVSKIVIGYDHHFGKGRGGNADTLTSIGKESGFTVANIPSYKLDDIIISSTKVRNALSEGNVALALKMLGRGYRFSGIVVGGDKRGRELGYPTANIQLNYPEKLLPLIGIYAVKVILQNQIHNGLLSIGRRPTFYEDGEVVSEVYIYDFNKQIYGEKLTIELVERLRGEEKFNSTDELIAQMNKDRDNGMNVLKNLNN
ncbi:MAG TPA: bifunctional riboflavin kinase/FAD synthetase [Ignavibacteriaceae bacterium]|nr:bifunctional riboflavin kinase/FAD synthetase [Ignavibacteriaceae bacterium]